MKVRNNLIENQGDKGMTLGRITLTLAAIIGVVEAIIMLGFGMMEPLLLVDHPAIEALLDVSLLTLLSAPLVNLLVLRPVIQQKKREAEVHEAMNLILNIALQPLDMKVVLGKILDTVLDIPWLRVLPQGAVFLMDSRGLMSMVAQSNMSDDMKRNCLNLSDADCPMVRAAKERHTLFSSCADSQVNCPGKGGMHGHMAIPILSVTGDVLGVLDLYLAHGHKPRQESRFFLNSVVHTIADIIERDRIAKRIEYGDTLQAIMDHAPFGIWLADANGHPQFVNATLCEEIGVPIDKLLDAHNIGDLFDAQVRNEFSVFRGRGLANDQQRTVYSKITVPDKGVRDFKITRVNIRNESREVDGFIGIVEDVTETRQLNERIVYQASHDALSGLLNRSAFEQKLHQVCRSTVSPQATPHALCYIDLDEFKVVNDTCGHQAGDELLKQITALYLKQLRCTEYVHTLDGDRLEPALARLGGDEFGLLLYNCTAEAAAQVARRLVDVTTGFHFVFMEQYFSIGCSIGVAEINHQNEGANSILKCADEACYLAKEKGRARVHVYLPDDEEILRRSGAMLWVPRIHDALENDRFVLYFQPIVALSGDESGDRFEVLVRYSEADADGGVVPPGSFLPAAERYSLMSRVDRWIIDHTFEELVRYYGPGSTRMLVSASINLSGQTLGEEWLLDCISQYFISGSIRPDQICLEITETAAIANMETAMTVITQLKALGCHFALDDFGSGLSSFSYLKEMDVDYLKIDGSLVKDIVQDPVGRVMVESINRIGHTMGIKTVAEWVEDDAIRRVLRDLGVDFVQGYSVGRPVPFDSLR